MRYRSCSINISAQVFIPEHILYDELEEGGEEKEVFEELARERIEDILPDDDPIKIYEIEFDFDSYK